MTARILVVDDDDDIRALLQTCLELEGYQVSSASDGVEALHILQDRNPDLVLLDVMMPRMNGWETCRRLRERAHTPIIMLTALGTEKDTIRGLETGADDYIKKPFSTAELLARIRAVLRRHRYFAGDNGILTIDEHLAIDRSRCQVIVDGQRVDLTSNECRVLTCLLDNPRRIVTHQSLLTQVWGWEYSEQVDYVKVYIHRLRQKIERDMQQPSYILTERGLGYRFEMPQ